MRPRTLDELVGQEHVVGPGTLLRRAIEADRLSSLILWGPPGSGKTTLARIIAATTQAHFAALSAVTSGVADLRAAIKEAADRLGMHGQRTVLFIDEIHRFNKAQQDAILPSRRGRHRHPDRRDDGEPIVRGQLAAALPLARDRPPAR